MKPRPSFATRFKRRRPSLHHRKRFQGTATVEAVIMIPTFVILLFGVSYASQLFGAILAATDRARWCVQHYAMAACEEGAIPEACVGLLHPPGQAPAGSESDSAMDEARAHSGVQYAESSASVLTDVLDGLLGEGHLATVNSSVQPHPVLSAKSTPVSATSFAICNTKPVNTDSVSAALVEAIGL